MARYAMVHTESGFIANVIEWSGDLGEWQPPVGYNMVEDVEFKANPGFRLEAGEFKAPPGGLPGTNFSQP